MTLDTVLRMLRLGGVAICVAVFTVQFRTIQTLRADRDAVSGALASANAANATAIGHIQALLNLNQQQASDIATHLQRLDAISRTTAARLAALDTLTHEDPAAESWGDTRLPDSVVSLLDPANTGRDAATDRAAAVPADGGVLAADPRTDDQPATGAGADRDAGGA